MAKKYPYSFYALLANQKLGKNHSLPQEKPLKLKTPLNPISQETIAVVNVLNEMNLTNESQNLLDYFSQNYQDISQHMKDVLALQWMDSADYYQAVSFAANHLDRSVFSTGFDLEDPSVKAMYPLAYQHEAQLGYKASHLPKGVIEAIMREESLFRPVVASIAGAKGLMQLMPQTAQMQARHIGFNNYSFSHLENPASNILLGSTFFKSLLQRYNNQFPLAIMAYNAGPGNVNKWLQKNKSLPLDEFIEEIPFSETRSYVKRVTRSMMVYGVKLNEPVFEKQFFSMQIK